MPSYSTRDSFKKLRSLVKRQTSARVALQDHSAATDVDLEIVSEPIPARSPPLLPPAPTPQESTVISTICRNASDAAQTFLPPVQAVADIIPGVGSVIKGAIFGILCILQLVDRYIQNKEDLEKLTLRLHLLRQHMDHAPIARTTVEETLRLQLLSALQTAKSQLEKMEKRIRGAPSLTQDIARCIATINNHLFEYMVFSQMQLQDDVSEIKTSIVECHSRQMRLIENSVATGATRLLPKAISRGYAILVDATGREHPVLLDHCRYLDQLNAMLSVILFQCRPDEAEIQRWYIERKQYDFVVYNRSHSDVVQLTRESDIWSNMKSGTRIVMRAITEEVVDSTVTATYTCPCGTPNTVNVNIGEFAVALQRGCTITCRDCERRFQITRTRRQRSAANITSLPQRADVMPVPEAKHLIRNFLAKQVFLRTIDSDTTQRTSWRMFLNNYLQCQRSRFSWSITAPGPSHDSRWLAVAYVEGIEYGRGVGPDKRTAMELAAEATYRALTDCFKISYLM